MTDDLLEIRFFLHIWN